MVIEADKLSVLKIIFVCKGFELNTRTLPWLIYSKHTYYTIEQY